MDTIEMMVNGKMVDVDWEELLTITNISADMDKVAAQMSFWASLHAEAEVEKIKVDTYYRNWRAKAGQRLLESDPKLAEWKVRQAIESQNKFGVLKEAIAKASHNTTVTRGIYESLRTKANMLQSKGAMMRAELDATGMSTPTSAKSTSSQAAAKKQDRATKVEAMKGLGLGKKHKKKKAK